MNLYDKKIQEVKASLQKKLEELSNINIAELEAQKAEYQKKIKEIDAQIQAVLKAAGIESSDEAPSAPAAGRLRSRKLPRLVEGSEEWKKVAGQVAIVMKNYPGGLNGKEIAYKLGLTEPNAVTRVQPVIKATLRREGEGVATRYFLPKS